MCLHKSRYDMSNKHAQNLNNFFSTQNCRICEFCECSVVKWLLLVCENHNHIEKLDNYFIYSSICLPVICRSSKIHVYI